MRISDWSSDVCSSDLGQAVDQQGEVDLAVLGAVAFAVGLQRCELIVQQQLGVVQQAADQRALAVIHAAAGDKAQQSLGLVLLQVGGYIGAYSAVHGLHQK